MFAKLSDSNNLNIPTKFAQMLGSSKDWYIGIISSNTFFIANMPIPYEEIFSIGKSGIVAGNHFVTLPEDLCNQLNLKAGDKFSCCSMSTKRENRILFTKL